MSTKPQLDDGEVLHRANPRTFSIPRGEVRRNLPLGTCQARLVFPLAEAHADGCRAERMWCLVRARHGERYLGELVNTPVYLQELTRGMEIEFEARHVIGVSFRDELPMAPLLGCSLGVLRGGAWPTWLVRVDAERPEDSGWRVLAENDGDPRLRAVSASALLRAWACLDSVIDGSNRGAWAWDGAALEFVARDAAPARILGALTASLGRLPAPPPPARQRAIVSQRALESKPSCAQRSPPTRGHDDDSGWSFWAGSESQAYMNETKNMTVVPLARLIHLFPYVERVLGEVGARAWEWDDEPGDWVDVTPSTARP